MSMIYSGSRGGFCVLDLSIFSALLKRKKKNHQNQFGLSPVRKYSPAVFSFHTLIDGVVQLDLVVSIWAHPTPAVF